MFKSPVLFGTHTLLDTLSHTLRVLQLPTHFIWLEALTPIVNNTIKFFNIPKHYFILYFDSFIKYLWVSGYQ